MHMAEDYLVDVVAAAWQLAKEQAPAQAGAECPLGHPNAPLARFCADCGMPVGEVTLTARVDLDAIREAVQRPVSPEEQERRDREHMQAVAANQAAEQRVRDVTQVQDTSKKKVLIHFVEDGFTWHGRVWQRGEMLEIGPEHPRWSDAVAWIRLSKQEQFARYGRVFFDFGPWPGAAAPEGTEIPLGTADASRWAHARRGLPARDAGDGTHSLVPF